MPEVIPFAERVQRLARDLAVEHRHERSRQSVSVVPERTWTEYRPPRPVAEWVTAGQVAEGHEANGLALPARVVDTLGVPGPAEYVVIGEERYGDGRWYLAVAVAEEWANAQRPPCPDCGGTNGRHDRVDFLDEKTGRTRKVLCPSAPRVRR